MDSASIFRAWGVIGCEHCSHGTSELELPCTHAAHEQMDVQMCSEWAQKLIANGG